MNRINVVFEEIRLNIKRGDYPCIGSGSGRQVFDLGNGYVVKAALNRKGLAQNKVEYNISSNTHSGLFAYAPKVSRDYRFLIMERADRVVDISDVWKYYNVNGYTGLLRLREFKKAYAKYRLLPGDLQRSANWGIINSRPVIVDYGFTRWVKRRYY